MREHILESSARLFALHGFRGTSLQDIASDAGCSKASLLYHFTSKDAILAELLSPAAHELSRLRERLAGLDSDEAARAAVTGIVDVALRFRRQVRILIQDLDAMTSRSELSDLTALTEQLVDALAGRSPAPQARIRALMALTAIFLTTTGDFAVSEETLRTELSHGALRVLGRHND
jgi:AcrR family transcriptional regulator